MDGKILFINARLEASCFKPGQLLPESEVLPEIAVAGRSNVGKSSLINAIFNSRLAKTGQTPGKTRSINFYNLEIKNTAQKFRLVDLPLLKNDKELQEWIRDCGKNIMTVFTKSDKVPKSKWLSTKQNYVKTGLFSCDVPIITSGEKKDGIDELRLFISNFLSSRN